MRITSPVIVDYLSAIKKVVFANNAKIKSIGINAFQQCGGLVDIVLPKGLELIGAHAFEGCVSLENIVIPEGIKRIEAGTFSGCASLKSVYLPTSLEYIAEDAFFNCPQLSNITCKSEKFDFTNILLVRLFLSSIIIIPIFLCKVNLW